MGTYNTENYHEQGGSIFVVGGDLKVKGKLYLGETEMKQAAAVAEAAGSNVTKAEFKALLDALKAAGIMAASS